MGVFFDCILAIPHPLRACVSDVSRCTQSGGASDRHTNFGPPKRAGIGCTGARYGESDRSRMLQHAAELSAAPSSAAPSSEARLFGDDDLAVFGKRVQIVYAGHAKAADDAGVVFKVLVHMYHPHPRPRPHPHPHPRPRPHPHQHEYHLNQPHAQVQSRSSNLAVAFDNETWASFSLSNFDKMASPTEGDAKDAVSGVIYEAPFKVLKVCAFLREQISTHDNWELFAWYRPAKQGEEYQQNGTPPVAGELKLGMPLALHGSVTPVQAPGRWTSRAESVKLLTGSHYHFLGLLRGRGAAVCSYRWAIVSCSLDDALYLAPFVANSLQHDSAGVAMPYGEAKDKAIACVLSLSTLSAKTVAGARIWPLPHLCRYLLRMYSLLFQMVCFTCCSSSFSLGRKSFPLAAEVAQAGERTAAEVARAGDKPTAVLTPSLPLKRSKRNSNTRLDIPGSTLESPAVESSTAGSEVESPAAADIFSTDKFSTGTRRDLRGCGNDRRLLEIPTPELRQAALARIASHPRDSKWFEGLEEQPRKVVASRLFRAVKGRWSKELIGGGGAVESDGNSGDEVEPQNDSEWQDESAARRNNRRASRDRRPAAPTTYETDASSAGSHQRKRFLGWRAEGWE